MKCISCGNLIPDNSTSCPYCNSEVKPIDTQMQVPKYDIDVEQQTMAAANAVLESKPTTGEEDTITQNQNPVDITGNGTLPPTPPTPVENKELETLGGTKIGSSAPIQENKKRKNRLIFILIGAVLALILLAGGIFFYVSQFKSVDKRIDAVVNGFLSFTSRVKNESVTLGSGAYSVNASLNANATNVSAKLNGKYAYDLESKLIDFTINAESINTGEELIPSGRPLSIELYAYDAKLYVLLQNFYENYIYSTIEGYDELFKGTEKNDINYQIIVNAYKAAIKRGLKAATYKQSIKDVTINGKKKKVNVIHLNLTESNQKRIIQGFMNGIISNTKALEEMAKMNDTTAEKLKEELKSSLENIEYSKESLGTVEIYSEMFGNTFLGIKSDLVIQKNKINFEIYPITNGYKASIKKDGKEVFNLNFTSVTKKTTKTTDTEMHFDIIYYNDSQVANKFVFDIVVNEDVNPKAEKVNIKNSVDYRYISQEDQQKILTNISNYGSLGLLLQSFIGGNITTQPVVPQTPSTTTPQTNY